MKTLSIRCQNAYLICLGIKNIKKNLSLNHTEKYLKSEILYQINQGLFKLTKKGK